MIRLANQNDYIRICRMIQNHHLSYITPLHIKEDINNNRLYIIEETNKIVAFAARVYCSSFNNYAIKRLCIPNKKNRGKGYAQTLLSYLTKTRNQNYPLVCTPWENNYAMKHMLENLGFQNKYTFNEYWCLYEI